MQTGRRKLVLGGALAAALLVAGGIFYLSEQMARKVMPAPFPPLQEMRFALKTGDGRTVTGPDLVGRAQAIFFGFTHCPDVCPMTLYRLGEAAAQIDPQANKLGIVMISVDPERDSPQILAEFTENFGPAVTGLSGSRAAVDTAIKDFGIYALKVALDDGDYTLDHSAAVFLYDRTGRFFGTVSFDEPEEVSRQKLARLIEK